MKNLFLYVAEGSTSDIDGVKRELDLQVANSLELGWKPSDLLVLTNFAFQSRGARAVEVTPRPRPRTARLTSFHKTCCILTALEMVDPGETVWYHDVDAFQLQPFNDPPSERPLAFCLYSTRERMLVQGGSLFFNRTARPIFESVLDRLSNHGCRKDEFALTDVIGLPVFSGFFEVLDYSYNLGTTDFELRWQLADKPIKVVHFHPGKEEHRAVVLGGRNALGVTPANDRFRALLAKHGVPRDELPAMDHRELAGCPRYGSTSPFVRSLRRALSLNG